MSRIKDIFSAPKIVNHSRRFNTLLNLIVVDCRFVTCAKNKKEIALDLKQEFPKTVGVLKGSENFMRYIPIVKLM